MCAIGNCHTYIVDNVAGLLEIHWIDDLVIAIGFVTVCIFGLPSMSGI